MGKKFLPVTAAIVGLGTTAVKVAADFDTEMSKVFAISGATGDDFDKLCAKACEMGAKTKFSATEAVKILLGSFPGRLTGLILPGLWLWRNVLRWKVM